MALDHFVPQVHLKNFYSKTSPHFLYATRKSDLKRFPCKSQDVCRTDSGSTNSYLREPRLVEAFLLEIEPNYNYALSKLRCSEFDVRSVGAIAGFVAYINGCAPAAMRAHSAPLKAQLETTAELMEKSGALSRSSPELGSKTLPELLRSGQVRIRVDQKFPQAMGIDAFRHHQSLFGNSYWEVLRNEDSFMPFLTSDFPIAIEDVKSTIVNRIIPLSPDLAVRITPDSNLRGTAPDLTFGKLRVRSRCVDRKQVRDINRLIVRSAENLVFSTINSDSVFRFIAKNRNYRVDVVGERLATRNGYLHVFRQSIVPFSREL